MPKYQTTVQRKYRYSVIAKAEGEYCLVCYIETGRRRGPPKIELQIDHADSNIKNWGWDNLHLLCRKHNCRYRSRDHSNLFRDYGDQLERDRERESLPTWKSVFKDMIPYQDGSPEMQANARFEKAWLKIALRLVQEEGSLDKTVLIADTANAVHCSVQVVRNNYLVKALSRNGVFQETTDDYGHKMIQLRQPALRNPFQTVSRQPVSAPEKIKSNGQKQAAALNKTAVIS